MGRYPIHGFAAAAAMICLMPSALATTMSIRQKTITCKVGIFVGWDSNSVTSPQDELIIDAWINESNRGNGIRDSFCTNDASAQIRPGIMDIIKQKINQTNTCVIDELHAAQQNNWQALLALTKLENQNLGEIKTLIDFGIGSQQSAENATKLAESALSLAGKVGSVAGDAKKIQQIASVTQSGDQAARHLFAEFLKDKYVESATDVFKEAFSPSELGGALMTMYNDLAVSSGISQDISFSHSLCP